MRVAPGHAGDARIGRQAQRAGAVEARRDVQHGAGRRGDVDCVLEGFRLVLGGVGAEPKGGTVDRGARRHVPDRHGIDLLLRLLLVVAFLVPLLALLALLMLAAGKRGRCGGRNDPGGAGGAGQGGEQAAAIDTHRQALLVCAPQGASNRVPQGCAAAVQRTFLPAQLINGVLRGKGAFSARAGRQSSSTAALGASRPAATSASIFGRAALMARSDRNGSNSRSSSIAHIHLTCCSPRRAASSPDAVSLPR